MMIKLGEKMSMIFLLLLILGSAICCQNSETSSIPSATDTETKSFLWEISSDSTHIYLLGSVHIASLDLYPLAQSIEDVFDSADYLVVEVNTNNISESHSTELLMKYGVYPPGDGFKNNVSEDLYKKLDDFFLNHGVGLALLDDFRPFVIYNLMSQLILADLGYHVEYGIDMYYLEKAETSNKSVFELETAEFQLSLLASIPDEDMIKAIEYDINNSETGRYLQELFDAWQNGDVVKMEAVVFEAVLEDPELEPYYEIMYDQRNLNMVIQIEEFLAGSEVYFIVVGAAHLVGENGLLNLLRDRGYTVEQL